MEYITINQKDYKLVIGEGRDDHFRKSFNALTRRTFGFDFEQWYQGGYWKNQYIPYSLMDDDKVVSNVSVNIMKMEILGTTHPLIQLGTVMTDPAYQKQGLLRVLLERVLEQWQNKCDFIYLFANDSVLDFYPKFGFCSLNQYQCSKEINRSRPDEYITELNCVKKLNMDAQKDRALVYKKAASAAATALVSMLGNAELILFYGTLFMKDNVYYIPEQDAVVIAACEADTLELFGVFADREIPLDTILGYLNHASVKQVKLHFTPKDTDSYTLTPLVGEDTLFILGKIPEGLKERPFMFPSLSHT